MMIATERAIIENGSTSEMRSAMSLSKLQGRKAFGAAWLYFGYWLAGVRGHIRTSAEGNYVLTEKGEKQRVALSSSAQPVRQ